MRKVLVLLFALAAVSALSSELLELDAELEHHKNGFSFEAARAQFRDWTQKWDKVYADGEEFLRREAIFVKRVLEITAHNIRYSNGEVGWTAGISQWSDMTIEEFRKVHGYISTNGTRNAIPAPNYVKRYASLDWRSRGKMAHVKNQARCGSCWAFATTGAVEACVAIGMNSNAPSLSDQQLQDCMFSRKCDPGGGGGADAIDWVVNNGICSESAIPYTQSDQSCRSNGPKWKAGGRVHGNNEDQLYNMLQTGPVLIGINADPLMSYRGGVIDDAGLSRGRNHAVVVVGVQDNCHNGQACWIIRNSWGDGWAEKGHFRVMKGRSVIGLGDDSDMPVKCSAPGEAVVAAPKTADTVKSRPKTEPAKISPTCPSQPPTLTIVSSSAGETTTARLSRLIHAMHPIVG